MTTFLTSIGSIAEFILVFGVLVFLHEFGHFIFARLNKIEVEEFGFGYPPRMIKLFRAGGTDFTLNWIPFGGFCRMKGEAGDVVEPGSFPAANPWRRLATLLGGPVTNLILGMLLIAVVFSRIGAPDTHKVEVIDIAANSPAANVFQVNDIIVQLNGTPVDSMDKLTQLVTPQLGQQITLTILRGDQTLQVEITPRLKVPEGEGAMGVTISNPVTKITFFEAIPAAFMSTLDQGYQLIMMPVRLIRGQIAPSQARMVSVKGIYDIFAQVQAVDQQEAAIDPTLKGLNVLSFIAFISIALGFTNLLPIPALDGGHILFIIPELLFKKKIKPELEGKVHFVGYVLLMSLMVILLINDILHPVVLY